MATGFNIGAVALRLSTQSTRAPSHRPAGWAADAAHRFLSALEPGSLRPGPAGLGSGEDPLPGLHTPPPRCVLTWWRGSSAVRSYGHKRHRGGPTLMTSSDPITRRGPHLQAHRTGVGASTEESGATTGFMAGTSLVESGRSPAGGGRRSHRTGLARRVKPGPWPEAPAYMGVCATEYGRVWRPQTPAASTVLVSPSSEQAAGVFPPRRGAAKAFEGRLHLGCNRPTRIRGPEPLRMTPAPALPCGNRPSGHLLRGFHLPLLAAIVWKETGATQGCAANCVPSDDACGRMQVDYAGASGRGRQGQAPRGPSLTQPGWLGCTGRPGPV